MRIATTGMSARKDDFLTAGNYSQTRCISLLVCKPQMGFSVSSIIWVRAELMQITMQRTRPVWSAKTKKNDSRLLKNSEGNRHDEWNFCPEQEADIALFLRETVIRNIRKIFEGNYSIIARNRAITSNESWNTETIRVDLNAPITSKHVFPKRSVKMIDGTEKPKIISKFAKRAAWYNEFGDNL